MVRRRNIQSKNHLSPKKVSRRRTRTTQQTSSSSSSISSMMKQIPSENLDDETKLAKRHLTKEMWQLVSIAVKRMADELVSISNNQESTTPRIGNQQLQTTLNETNNVPIQSTVQQPIITNSGAGDEPFNKKKAVIVKEPTKRRTLPLQMLEPSSHMQKKGISNSATRRSVKSKIQNKSLKKNENAKKQRLHKSYKLK